jgi:ketosteroid isomerase-like protein
MSQAIPPLETIQAGFDAFNRGDYDAWIAIYDEDVEFLDLAETPDTGAYRGHAGARAWLAKLQEAWGEGFRFEPQSITQGADAVVVEGERAQPELGAASQPKRPFTSSCVTGTKRSFGQRAS